MSESLPELFSPDFAIPAKSLKLLEAGTGIEPVYSDLQSVRNVLFHFISFLERGADKA